MTIPVTLSVPARTLLNLHGHAGASVALAVRDAGKGPITVRASVASDTPLARAHPAQGWTRVSGGRVLRLRAGQTGTVHLRVTVPAGAHGTHYTNVIFSASPAGRGSIHLAGEVGGTLKITHPGMLAAHLSPLASTTAPGAGGPWLALGAAMAALLVLAALVVLVTRRRHRGVRQAR